MGIRVKLLIPPQPGKDWLDVMLADGDERLISALHNSQVYNPVRKAPSLPPESALVEVLS
jgi:hypothetical protein